MAAHTTVDMDNDTFVRFTRVALVTLLKGPTFPAALSTVGAIDDEIFEPWSVQPAESSFSREAIELLETAFQKERALQTDSVRVRAEHIRCDGHLLHQGRCVCRLQ